MSELSRYDAQVIDNILCDIETCTQKQRAAILESLRGTVVITARSSNHFCDCNYVVIKDWYLFCHQCGKRIKWEV